MVNMITMTVNHKMQCIKSHHGKGCLQDEHEDDFYHPYERHRRDTMWHLSCVNCESGCGRNFMIFDHFIVYY